MLTEKDFKEGLICRLNKVQKGWVDGDTESDSVKTADIVNHSLEIAIEIKDDTQSVPLRFYGNYAEENYDGKKLNRQFYSDIRNANQKFRTYNGYKTALLFRTNLPFAVLVRTPVEGLDTFERATTTEERAIPPDTENRIIAPRLTYAGRKGKHNRKEIGCCLVLNEDGYSYFPNEFATNGRKMDKAGIESLFGFSFRDA